jgi:hypothetical protein
MDLFFQGLVERSQKIKQGADQEIIKVDVQRRMTKLTADVDKVDPPMSPTAFGAQRQTRFTSNKGNDDSIRGLGSPNSRSTSFPVQRIPPLNRPGALAPINETKGNESQDTGRTTKLRINSPRLGLESAISPRSNPSYRSPAKSPILSPIKASFTNAARSFLEEDDKHFPFPGTSPRKVTQHPFKHQQNVPEKITSGAMSASATVGVIASGGGGVVGYIQSSSNATSFKVDHLDHSSNYHDFDIVKRKSFRAGSFTNFGGSWAPIAAGTHFVVPKRMKKSSM